jgi:hypothetical protein
MSSVRRATLGFEEFEPGEQFQLVREGRAQGPEKGDGASDAGSDILTYRPILKER